MAKLTKEDIIASLKEMTVLELNDLVKAVEAEFGVTAAAPVAAAAPVEEEEGPAAGPTEVSLFLKSVGASKVQVIKAVQAITGLGLMDAKKLTDTVPATIKEHISPVEAEEHKKALVAAGAEVEIK
ncbi:MAG: 50S ribosomal protein L7/L12 [Erysipelotrichaceae bacterium]|jgi:large subunit ribosomal protein L7/L12|nr:50S ribosomal protein L7/L12 [Bacilli bacterium]NLV28836.1 50S ribosomal protein L7/L12 [Erysipelotrichaceae bacterium]HPY80048.1 50S ribosomal protein L7/L12 [Bacilli bacterium]HQA56138.1 50S ribosomal protein L7/L12 [Bacilli bacterium]